MDKHRFVWDFSTTLLGMMAAYVTDNDISKTKIINSKFIILVFGLQ